MKKADYLFEFEKGMIPFVGVYNLLKRYEGVISKRSIIGESLFLGSIHTLLYILFPPGGIGASAMIGGFNAERKWEEDLESKFKTNEVLA